MINSPKKEIRFDKKYNEEPNGPGTSTFDKLYRPQAIQKAQEESLQVTVDGKTATYKDFKAFLFGIFNSHYFNSLDKLMPQMTQVLKDELNQLRELIHQQFAGQTLPYRYAIRQPKNTASDSEQIAKWQQDIVQEINKLEVGLLELNKNFESTKLQARENIHLKLEQQKQQEISQLKLQCNAKAENLSIQFQLQFEHLKQQNVPETYYLTFMKLQELLQNKLPELVAEQEYSQLANVAQLLAKLPDYIPLGKKDFDEEFANLLNLAGISEEYLNTNFQNIFDIKNQQQFADLQIEATKLNEQLLQQAGQELAQIEGKYAALEPQLQQQELANLTGQYQQNLLLLATPLLQLDPEEGQAVAEEIIAGKALAAPAAEDEPPPPPPPIDDAIKAKYAVAVANLATQPKKSILKKP